MSLTLKIDTLFMYLYSGLFKDAFSTESIIWNRKEEKCA